MKLWPDLFRSRAAAEPAPSKPHTAEGASGTINQRGFIVSDEYNPDLRWPQSLAVFRRMLRSDASVREAYMHVAAPIMNATWAIEPAGETPEDLEAAEFTRRLYFEWPDTGFEATLALTLKYLAQGYQVFELPERIVEAELVYADPNTGAETTVPRRQFLVWDRWAHRKPETVHLWHVEEGRLTGITQRAFKDNEYGAWEIPAENLAVFVNEQEGDDFTGVSLLRSANKAWWMKELVEKVMTMSVERHGLGINTGYVTANGDSAAVDKFEQMLQTLRAGDANYLVFPGPKQGTQGADGAAEQYLFEIVAPTGGLPDFTGPLEYLRGEIKGNVLARFSELGHGSTGARSTGDTQSQVWYDALHGCAAYLCSVHNALIERQVKKNFATLERFPKLVARDIEARSLSEFADANAKLVASGAILPDRSYRNFVRGGIDAPDEDEDAQDQLAPATEPLDSGTGQPKPAPDQTAAIDRARREMTALADDLERVTAELAQVRKKSDRSEIAAALAAQAELLKATIAALPVPRVEIGAQHHLHEHHAHDNRQGLSPDELAAALAVERELVSAEITRLLEEDRKHVVASQHVKRDDDGRLLEIREFNAEGRMIRFRRAEAHNDNGTVKTLRDVTITKED